MTAARHVFHRLESADAERLKELLGVFGAAFDEIATYQDALPSDAYLINLLASRLSSPWLRSPPSR